VPKPAKRPSKPALNPSPLREVVGDEIYNVWVKMLKRLVPDGRTHRLSMLVASMLAYASSIAGCRRTSEDENDPAYPLLAASDGMDDEAAFRLLTPMLTRLFKDAKVKPERVSSRGEQYSIAWEATIEFCRWYNYPWEG
jgi:hypothetical protein